MLQHHYEKHDASCDTVRFNDDRYPCTCGLKSNTLDKQQGDMVAKPSHYDFFPGVEAIVIIARSMTEKQFEGYCMGNALKYRLRAGKKWNTEEDLKKADQYGKLFEKYRHCCMQEDI